MGRLRLEDRHTVFAQRAVGGHQGKPAPYRLRHNHSVERIAVDRRQAGGCEGVVTVDTGDIDQVPVGQATVKLSADGYETVVEVVDVKEGNAPSQLTHELKRKQQ